MTVQCILDVYTYIKAIWSLNLSVATEKNDEYILYNALAVICYYKLAVSYKTFNKKVLVILQGNKALNCSP